MKKWIKTGIFIGMVLILLLGMTTVSFADNPGHIPGNESIKDDPTKPVVVDPDGPIVITPSNDSKYSGSPSDIAKKNGYNPEKMETTDGLTVNLRLYTRITEMMDLGEMKNGVISYNLKGEKDITIRADILKGLKISDLLVMIINPNTGRIYLIAPYAFDAKSGEMSFITPSYGKFCIIQKLPIVVRDVHPEDYSDFEVAEAIGKLPKDEYIELSEWLEAFGIEDEELEIAKDYMVDVDDYNSADYLADIAVKVNENVFNYKLNTRMWADLYQDVNEIDWGRVLEYAGVDYDVDEISKNPTKLTEIEPFILEDCFIYHVDAQTGDVSIAYEPEISFDTVKDGNHNAVERKVKNGLKDLKKDDIDLKMDKMDNVDNVNEVEDNVNHREKKELEDPDVNDTSLLDLFVVPVYAKPQDYYTKEQRDILTFDVFDIDEKNKESLCMVMSSDQYLGMGPFVLFMPKEKTFFWWILILLAILAIIVAFVVCRHNKNKNRKCAEEQKGI